jgi:hypothetical protein
VRATESGVQADGQAVTQATDVLNRQSSYLAANLLWNIFLLLENLFSLLFEMAELFCAIFVFVSFAEYFLKRDHVLHRS